MNKELTEIYVPISVEDRLPDQMFNTINSGDSWKVGYFHKKEHKSDQWSDDAYGTHLTFPKYWLEKQSRILLTKEEWEEIRNVISNEPYQKRDWNKLEIQLEEKDKEIQRLTSLIDTSWYDGYCKAGEKELAYDLLQQFKKQNNL